MCRCAHLILKRPDSASAITTPRGSLTVQTRHYLIFEAINRSRNEPDGCPCSCHGRSPSMCYCHDTSQIDPRERDLPDRSIRPWRRDGRRRLCRRDPGVVLQIWQGAKDDKTFRLRHIEANLGVATKASWRETTKPADITAG